MKKAIPCDIPCDIAPSQTSGEIDHSKWGVCMTDCAEPMQRWINSLIGPTTTEFNYVELGVYHGQTFSQISDVLLSRPGLNAKMIGVDIKTQYFNVNYLFHNMIRTRWADEQDLDVEAVLDRIKFIDFENVFPEDNVVDVTKLEPITIVLKNGQELFAHHWSGPIDFALIDACHGKPCVKSDFMYLSRHIRKGGIVAFHDTGVAAQGRHIQTHCRTGINVRAAVRELGLLDGELNGWRLLEDVPADIARQCYGIAFFKFIGVTE